MGIGGGWEGQTAFFSFHQEQEWGCWLKMFRPALFWSGFILGLLQPGPSRLYSGHAEHRVLPGFLCSVKSCDFMRPLAKTDKQQPTNHDSPNKRGWLISLVKMSTVTQQQAHGWLNLSGLCCASHVYSVMGFWLFIAIKILSNRINTCLGSVLNFLLIVLFEFVDRTWRCTFMITAT